MQVSEHAKGIRMTLFAIHSFLASTHVPGTVSQRQQLQRFRETGEIFRGHAFRADVLYLSCAVSVGALIQQTPTKPR